MKKCKILSLLLALVLVVSAAGTAFAASDTQIAGKFGKLTGTINQVSGQYAVTATASITKVLTKTTLSLGVHWVPTNDPTYTTFGDDVPKISNTYFVPFTTLESAPTEAHVYCEVYAPGEGPYTAHAETPLTMPK